MKKKILSILITILAVCTLMFTMTACGEPPHTHRHEYNSVVIEPTCTEKGYTTYTCTCGDSYVDAYVDELGHEYGVGLSNGDGTHTKTCANDNSHKITEYCFVGETTCYNVVCDVCGTNYTQNHVYEKEHCKWCNASEGIAYTLSGNSYSVSGIGTCNHTDIVIPSTYNGKTVTVISSSAFQNTKITSIVIPDSVTQIGSASFSGCSSLISITLPFVGAKAGVTSSNTYQYPFGYIFGESSYSGSYSAMQYYCGSSTSIATSTIYYIPSSLKSVTITGGNILYGAFYGCDSLTSVVIGDSVTSIGSCAFEYCYSLTSIVIGDSVTSIGSSAFYNCSLLTYNVKGGLKYLGNTDNPYMYLVDTESTDITIATIDSNCRIIASNAFSGCSSLTSVEIPDSVTSIGYNAFSGCSSLTSVVIPDSVTSIGDWAFYGCSKLTSVVIGDSATSIGERAFYDCTSLTSVEIPDSVTSIGDQAFRGCDSLTYNIKDGLKYLGNNNNKYLYLADVESNSITSATIDNNCRFIGTSAFSSCTSLTSVVIGNSVTSIGYNAFFNCSSLTSVVIGDSVTSIGSSAFSYCSSLTSIVIGDSVTSIGNYAFEGCRSLISVEIPDSVESIGFSVFKGCDSLTSVVIPDSVTSIGNSAFSSCDSLTSIVIPDSVTSIGEDAFFGCSSLTSIVIPDSVTRIGSHAFSNCDSLTYNIKDGLKYLGNNNNKYLYLADVESISITSATIDNNCRFIGTSAFYDCSSLTSVVIGDSVTSIGDYAFENCSSLTSIKYRGTESQWQAITKGSNWNYNTGNYTITYNYKGL